MAPNHYLNQCQIIFNWTLRNSVGNSHRSTSPRPTTLEEGQELYVDLFSILCLWFWDSRYEDLQLFWLSLKHCLGTHLSEIIIEIPTFSFKKIHLKMLSANWQPFCLGLNVITTCLISQQAVAGSLGLPVKQPRMIWVKSVRFKSTSTKLHQNTTNW